MKISITDLENMAAVAVDIVGIETPTISDPTLRPCADCGNHVSFGNGSKLEGNIYCRRCLFHAWRRFLNRIK